MTNPDEQAMPVPQRDDLPDLWSQVIDEMYHRRDLGISKYGTPLQPFNGRNAWLDRRQEVLDWLVYDAQLGYELDWLRERVLGLMDTKEYFSPEARLNRLENFLVELSKRFVDGSNE